MQPLTQSIQPSGEAREFLCFGATAGHGNPALVVLQGPATIEQRQHYARDSGKTCVFVDPADDARAAYVLDFYYPHARSPLCVHASVAAARLLAHGQPVTVRTALHGQLLQLHRDGDMYAVALQRQQAPEVRVSRSQLRELLGNQVLGFVSEARVASVGSPKLLVQVNDAGTLYRLQPDLAAISAWSREHGVSGIYVYWVCSDGEVEGRNFNHLDPALEDSATGVAAGALSVLMERGLHVCQGAAMGNPCLMATSIDGDAVSIGGYVRER
ncbi:PhzF family phenazine biosynthesis protein [Pseudoduganella sp. GCM10020061]|uniref:PhzF family phenazine biosynthesis protein n=1 Tax=Pseudoduganella sp. GCM10020061 TaxID=3317345 RepID=UPI003637452E